MLNMSLFTPRNIIVIGVFSVLALTLAKTMFAAVDTKPEN
jgi:hypothetical protein